MHVSLLKFMIMDVIAYPCFRKLTWNLNSPATRVFVQQFVRADTKETSNVRMCKAFSFDEVIMDKDKK